MGIQGGNQENSPELNKRPRTIPNQRDENFRSWVKEVKKTQRHKNLPCSQVIIINLMKIPIPPEAVYTFHESQTPEPSFTNRKTPKSSVEPPMTKANTTSLNRTNSAGITTPTFKVYYWTIIISQCSTCTDTDMQNNGQDFYSIRSRYKS